MGKGTLRRKRKNMDIKAREGDGSEAEHRPGTLG